MAHEDGILHRRSDNFGKAPAELIHDTTITDGAVRLYCHMHWRYGSNHDNHESANSMAEIFAVGEKTIRNRIKELELKDWVVTIERKFNKKTGKYQTPFYHVFELQSDGIRFRKSYQPAEDERIAPKHENTRERKPREKGAGGNPKLKSDQRKINSEGDQRNLSSGVRRNSSSDNPDSFDPESFLLGAQKIRKQFPIWNTAGLKYKDGKFCDPMLFTGEVNAVFYAWIDALTAAGREPVGTPDYLWEKSREDARALALSKVTPQQVAAYVAAKYADPKDAFWRDKDEHMPLSNVAKGIGGFLKKASTVQDSKPAEQKPAPNAALEQAIAEELAKLPELPPDDYQPTTDAKLREMSWKMTARRNLAKQRAEQRLGVSA